MRLVTPQRAAEASHCSSGSSCCGPPAAPSRRPAHQQQQQRLQQRPYLAPTILSSSSSSSCSGHARRLRLQCSASSPLRQAQAEADAQLGGDAAAAATQQQQPVAGSSPPPAQADVLIEFKNVWKAFGSKQILRGATFKIRRGEAVGIIGSSGTGKSTTLRLAAGLLEPDRGEVLIKGEPRHGLISDDDTSDKLKVGLVFQSGALFDSLTVGENVGFLLHEHTKLPAPKIQELVSESLGKVGLSGVEALYPSELSGGMKKRVALARAIVRDEKHDFVEQVIMYDEPTAGLDPVASTVVEDLIRDLHEKHGEGHHHEHHHEEHGHVQHAHHHHGHHHHSSHHEQQPRNGPRAHSGAAASNGNGNGAGAGAAAQGQAQQQAQQQEEHRECPPGGITSYIVVTHQHSTIRRAVDRIIFLHEGRVVWEGSVEEFDTTDEPIVRQFASGSLQGPIKYE